VAEPIESRIIARRGYRE